MTIFKNIQECIGNTPTIELNHPLVPNNKKLFVKLEAFNPTFSIKDRTALGLVKHAFKTNQLAPGGILIESTSGNLGKSLAMLGAAMKFKVILVLDPKAPKTLINWCQAFGATIIMVEEADENGGYQQARIRKVNELLTDFPTAYWPNQYDNPANPDYHYQETSKEILTINADSVFGAVSTGGHLTGIARSLKEANSDIKIVACDVKGSAIFGDPFKPYLLNGIGLAWPARNIDFSVLTHLCKVSDEEAISVCFSVARHTGLLVGGSGGVVLFAALSYLYQGYSDKALAIIPDSGINYLQQIFDNDWLLTHGIEVFDHHELSLKSQNLQFQSPDAVLC